MRLEPLGPQQRVGQINQKTHRDGAGERIIEDHGWSPLKPFAGVGVADRYDEEAEAKGQHGDIQHETLLMRRKLRVMRRKLRGRAERFPPLLGGEVPLHAFVFETDATLKL
jgi:hypothetical protein